jgi:hypothetical protein
MKRRVHLVVCDDDGHEATCADVAVFEKACQHIEHLGLTLPEAKQILIIPPIGGNCPHLILTRKFATEPVMDMSLRMRRRRQISGLSPCRTTRNR